MSRRNSRRFTRNLMAATLVMSSVAMAYAGSVSAEDHVPPSTEARVPDGPVKPETPALPEQPDAGQADSDETGEVDGAIVAVGSPPVPPTSSLETAIVAVGVALVPPAKVIVAVGKPPVPTVIVPDADESHLPLQAAHPALVAILDRGPIHACGVVVAAAQPFC